MSAYVLPIIFTLTIVFSPATGSAEPSFDHSDWQALIAQNVRHGRVHYAGMQQDLETLSRYLETAKSITKSTLARMSREERIAFWINLYNATIVRVIVEQQPKESIEEIPEFWDAPLVAVAGDVFSLRELRDQILRRQFRDERIVVALVTGRMDSPQLFPDAFQGGVIEQQLNHAARIFVEDEALNQIELGAKKIYLSSWLEDFAGDFIFNYGTVDPPKRFSESEAAIISFFLDHVTDPEKRLYLNSGKYRVKYLPPDNRLNQAVQPVHAAGEGLYGAVLGRHVEQGWVHYSSLRADRDGLDRYVTSLSSLTQQEYDDMQEAEQIAFWLNAYNAITLQVIIDHYPIQKRSGFGGFRFPKNSIRQIPGVWKNIHYEILGDRLSLTDIEHEILRKKFTEPRIHMALVCAAKGCPPLRNEPYLGARLEEQLDDQTVQFLSSPDKFRIGDKGNVVFLSPIFDWFGDDFAPKHSEEILETGLWGERAFSNSERAVLNFIRPYVSEADRAAIDEGVYEIWHVKYDWSLNDAVRLGA